MKEIFDLIDSRLEDLDGAECVSRFYSDSENVVIMCDPHIKSDVKQTILDLDLGLRLYDVGGDDSKLMMTFKF